MDKKSVPNKFTRLILDTKLASFRFRRGNPKCVECNINIPTSNIKVRKYESWTFEIPRICDRCNGKKY